MFSTATRTVASRSAVRCLRSIRPLATQRMAGNPTGRRFQSTSRTTTTNPEVSPLLAGAAGGLVVLGGGYIWYNVSGTRKVIQTTRKTIETVEATKEKIKEALTPPSPREALDYVRSTVQAYSHLLPSGTKEKIDSAFDTIDVVIAEGGPRAEELNKIVADTYNELKKTFSEGGFDAQTAERVKRIVEEKSKAVRRLIGDIGQQIMDKNPKLAQALQSTGDSAALNELRKIAEETGPEAKRLLDETYRELNDLLKEGSATSPVKIYEAANLIRDKTNEARKLARKAAERAWDEAFRNFTARGGTMEALPEDLQRIIDDNIDTLRKVALSSGGVGGVYELFGMIRKYSGGDRESTRKLKDYIESKVGEGGSDISDIVDSKTFEKTARQIEEYVKSIPGGETALGSIPPLTDFVDLAKQKSPEARKLVQETLEDLTEVLNKRLAQAKQLAKETKDDGKQRREHKMRS